MSRSTYGSISRIVRHATRVTFVKARILSDASARRRGLGGHGSPLTADGRPSRTCRGLCRLHEGVCASVQARSIGLGWCFRSENQTLDVFQTARTMSIAFAVSPPAQRSDGGDEGFALGHRQYCLPANYSHRDSIAPPFRPKEIVLLMPMASDKMTDQQEPSLSWPPVLKGVYLLLPAAGPHSFHVFGSLQLWSLKECRKLILTE